MNNIRLLNPDVSQEVTTNWRNTSTEYNGLKELYCMQEETMRGKRVFHALGPGVSGPPESYLYACHITAYLPSPEGMVPRATIRKAVDPMTGALMQVPKWVEEINSWKRPTLHWTINQCMRSHDKNTIDPTTRCFAIIEPIEALQEEALGGMLDDFETLGVHQLSERAVVLVPRVKEREFAVQRLVNLGRKIEYYDGTKQSLSEAIDLWIQGQNAYLLSPCQPGQQSLFHLVDSKQDLCVPAIDVMASLGLRCFPHDFSPMRQIELLVSLLLAHGIKPEPFAQKVEEYSQIVERFLLGNEGQRCSWLQYRSRLTKIVSLFIEMDRSQVSDEEKFNKCRDVLWNTGQCNKRLGYKPVDNTPFFYKFFPPRFGCSIS